MTIERVAFLNGDSEIVAILNVETERQPLTASPIRLLSADELCERFKFAAWVRASIEVGEPLEHADLGDTVSAPPTPAPDFELDGKAAIVSAKARPDAVRLEVSLDYAKGTIADVPAAVSLDELEARPE